MFSGKSTQFLFTKNFGFLLYKYCYFVKNPSVFEVQKPWECAKKSEKSNARFKRKISSIKYTDGQTDDRKTIDPQTESGGPKGVALFFIQNQVK